MKLGIERYNKLLENKKIPYNVFSMSGPGRFIICIRNIDNKVKVVCNKEVDKIIETLGRIARKWRFNGTGVSEVQNSLFYNMEHETGADDYDLEPPAFDDNKWLWRQAERGRDYGKLLKNYENLCIRISEIIDKYKDVFNNLPPEGKGMIDEFWNLLKAGHQERVYKVLPVLADWLEDNNHPEIARDIRIALKRV